MNQVPNRPVKNCSAFWKMIDILLPALEIRYLRDTFRPGVYAALARALGSVSYGDSHNTLCE